MKLKNLGVVLTIIIILMMLMLVPNKTYATNGYSIGYVFFRDTKDGYIIGDNHIDNPNADGVWKLVSYDKNSSEAVPGEGYNEDKSIYCLKAGVGFIEQMDDDNNRRYISNVVDYDYSVNFFNNKDTIKNLLSIDDETYNKIAWIIDHMYIPTDDDNANRAAKESLFKKVTWYDDFYEMDTNLWEESGYATNKVIFTDEDIDVVQQLALWYFTNANETAYHQGAHTIHIGENKDAFHTLQPEVRQECANELYRYLITNADGSYNREETDSSRQVTFLSRREDIEHGFWAEGEKLSVQPIVIIENEVKEFDLALRKYITSIERNGNVINIPNAPRIPEIDTSTLQTGTTATYKHRKDPVLVETGDIVTYNITIYNEGEEAGRATKIMDFLPDGVEFLDVVTEGYEAINVNVPIEGNPEISEYKGVMLIKTGENNLAAYSGEGLPQSETVQIRCKVTENRGDTEKILTNVAYISEAYNADKGITITNQEKADRDSEPSTYPIVNESTLPSYKGNGNKDDLADSEYFYKGYQDDDDFEKLKLAPREKELDIALRKFITGISSQGVERIITSRIPDVDTSTIATTKTATYNHSKKPVPVRIGDIVTYTIRVYNEGEVDGYVSEITDHLPEWLEFIGTDYLENGTDEEKEAAEFNVNFLWEVSGDGRTIKTSRISKEKSDTYSYMTGIQRDNTLLKAFDGGEELDYVDVKVKCKVKSTATSGTKITNIADITGMQDKDGRDITTDRDSYIDNVELPTDENLPNYKDNEINKPYVPGQEDDDDFEKLVVQIFDLALRKFITAVDDRAIVTRYPQPTMGEDGNIKYVHTKEPVGVATGNLVTYTIRVYNEGEIAGYAKEVTDNLPEGLKYLPENGINKKYGWIMRDENGDITEDIEKAVCITTNYLSKQEEDANEGRDNLINAFDKEIELKDGNPDYKDLLVVFEVTEPNTSDRILINTAQISEDEDEDGNPVDDVDSIPNRDEDYDFDDDKNNEDDIDIEKVKLLYFDLALRKFITGVNDMPVNNRYPQLSLDEDGKIIYTHTKVPVDVENGNIVTYTIRVYNEGNMNGYAKEVTDDMPDGLEFLPDNETNKEYRWVMIDEDGKETEDITKAVKITTDYLSKEQGEQNDRDNLIKAYDKEVGITDENPDYRDLKVAFKVTEPNTSDRILVNTAEISDDEDENGDPVDDIDSTPDNGKEDEDDIDKEYVKVKYFDLALKKWVSQAIVTENGKTTVTDTGHTGDENPEPAVKVEIKENSLKNVTVKFAYKIKIINEGEIAGYAKEIKDYIPAGLKFVAEDNPLWYEVEEGVVATAQLENTLLQPGETATVDIVLTWINGEDNMGLKTNVAEISKDYNESNTPDIDSTPDNKKPGEDDIDDAPVLLSIKTGSMPMYLTLTTFILVTLTGGIILIKKYVLA